MRFFALAVSLALMFPLAGQQPERIKPGPSAGGTVLPTGWRIRPAGRQIRLDTMPVRGLALDGGRRILVLHSGYRPPTLALLNRASGKLEHSLRVPDAGHGFAFHPASGRIYVAGGHSSSVIATTLSRNGFSAPVEFPLSWPGNEYPRSLASDVALSNDGRTLFVCEQRQDSIAVLDARNGTRIRRFPTGARPARVLPASDGRHLYVAAAERGRVIVREIATGGIVAEAEVSSGPADLLEANGRLYVAGSGSNFIDVLDASALPRLRSRERLNLALFPKSPGQATPSHLSYDSDTRRLYATCSDLNAVAVIKLSGRNAEIEGYIPTGWYPTATVPLPGPGLLILNGKGGGSSPNPKGPNPARHRTMTPQPPSDIEYIPLLQLGSASVIERVDRQAIRAFTEQVYRLTPRDTLRNPSGLPESHPVPLRRGGRSPIRHVILIMKENRTYDQVLGDMPEGNGEPSLCLFPERITPNHHKLAREFTLFDNFYVNADVSAEGWLWTSAAITPHFVMKGWPAAYAGRARRQDPNASPRARAGEDLLLRPSAGYLWTKALQAGVSFRNYGFFVQHRRDAEPGEPIFESVSDPALEPYTNRYFAGYDPDFPDVERARVFIDELREFEAKGSFPNLITMVLPNDHTWGTTPGKLTPYSSMADNDLALGRIVEAVSRSRFWPATAIFVVEDDAQNGPDHVDSHRAPAFVISPYTRRGFVDSNMYNTTSVLRTIELILGLSPLTQYDATAAPILAAFQSKADARHYRTLPANVSLDERNPAASETAALSDSLDLSAPDRADDATLNAILWLALKGTPPPPPTRSYFIRELKEE